MFRHTTGQRLQPSVQQQNAQPQNSQRTFIGIVLRSTLFTRRIVSLNSSGASLPVSAGGNSVVKRLFKPKLQEIEW